MSESIVLIDLSAIFWTYWHQSESAEISSAKRRTIQLVESLIRDHTYGAVCVDVPPYNRKKIYPEYKAGREHPPLAIEELRGALRDLKAFGVPYYAVPGFEADDVIATLSNQALELGLEVYISGTDKDLLQIKGVIITEPFERKVLTPEEKFGVPADLVHDILALSGDKADNVPGLPGIGPVKAKQIIDAIGSVQSFLRLPDDKKMMAVSSLPEKAREVILSNITGLELSYDLVGLEYNVPIDLKLVKDTTIMIEKEPVTPGAEEANVVVETVPEESKQVEVQTLKTEVAIRADSRNANWALSLEPCDLNSAWKLSNYLHESRMFGQFPNPQAVMSIIMRGRSLGMDATTALSNFHVIEGKPTMHASLIVGLVLTSGKCEYFDLVETTDKIAVWATKRTGRPELKFSYTIDEANSAKLTGPTRSGKPSNWHTRPKTMLRWRAATELARAIYPDVVTGLYTPDEIDAGEHLEQ